MKKIIAILILCAFVQSSFAQVNDVTTPLHKLQPDYPVPYGIPKDADVVAVIDRVYNYLNVVTPIGFINEKSGQPVTDLSKFDADTILARGDFRIVSYEWGVTYAGMLLANEVTKDAKYRDYAEKRLTFIGDSTGKFKKPAGYEEWEARMPLRNLISPRNLDDTGAMVAAMIKAKRGGSKADIQRIIEVGIDHIMNKQYRLKAAHSPVTVRNPTLYGLMICL
jgi:hypothetical protein